MMLIKIWLYSNIPKFKPKQNTMKNLTKLLCVLFVVLTISCSKDSDVNTGTGATVYNFETDFTLSSVTQIKEFILPISKSAVDSSLILGFYKDNNCGTSFWYQSTGLGCAGSYQVRSYMSNSTSNTLHYFQLYDIDGSSYNGSSILFTQYKVIVIPASSIVNGRKKDPKTMTYEEVCKAYNIKE